MKAPVLIVAKTRVKHQICVGGLGSGTYQNVRLLQPNGFNQPHGTSYTIGDIWELNFTPRTNTEPPHVEDILVTSQIFKGRVASLRQTLLHKIRPWRGAPTQLFQGMLQFTDTQTGYICRHTGVPEQSVGFWIIPAALRRKEHDGRTRYALDKHSLNMPYVGLEQPPEQLPPGTLVRLSLARWWHPPDAQIEDRCYLQLSGWY